MVKKIASVFYLLGCVLMFFFLSGIKPGMAIKFLDGYDFFAIIFFVIATILWGYDLIINLQIENSEAGNE